MSPNPAILTWPRPVAVASGTLAADTFTRANNATSMGDAETGGTWTTTGTWGILNNRARCYSNDTVATLNVGRSYGYRAQVDFGPLDWPGLVLRYADTDNMYWLEHERTGILLMRRLGGTPSILATMFTAQPPTTVYVEVTEPGGTLFTVWTDYNGTPVTYTDSTAGRPTGTRVGLRGQDLATRGEFDNFLVEAL